MDQRVCRLEVFSESKQSNMVRWYSRTEVIRGAITIMILYQHQCLHVKNSHGKNVAYATRSEIHPITIQLSQAKLPTWWFMPLLNLNLISTYISTLGSLGYPACSLAAIIKQHKQSGVCHRVVKEPLMLSTLGNEINFPKIHSKQSEAIQDSNCEAVILDLSRRSWISSLAFCMATDNCTFRSCEIPSTLRAHSWQVNQKQHPIVPIDSWCFKVNQPKNHSHWNKVKVGGSSRSTYFDIIFRYISHLSWKLVQTVPQLVLYLCFDLAAQTIPNVLSAHTHGEMPWRTLDGCGVLGMQLSNGERVSNYTIQSDLYDLQSMIKYDSK